jgi:RNAse (barnase) inhibitor barstar
VEIFLDWGKIKSYEEFYEEFLPQVRAPKWHGRNLDALADSIITGGINEIEPPFCVINKNVGNMKTNAKHVYDAVSKIFKEANEIGNKIRVFEE